MIYKENTGSEELPLFRTSFLQRLHFCGLFIGIKFLGLLLDFYTSRFNCTLDIVQQREGFHDLFYIIK